MKKAIISAFLAFLCLWSSAQTWESRYENNSGYTVESTQINGRDATVIQPVNANGRWIARPAFMGAFAQVDEALLEMGWAFAYYDVTEEYANPTAQNDFTAFYDWARKKYKLSDKVTLEGFSRGGFFSLVYAINNPEKIEKLYLDAPLCDLDLFKEWPQDYQEWVKGRWSSNGISLEEIHDYPLKHFDNIKLLPIIVVYGAADEVVRFESQFGRFDLSGCKEISIIGKTGCNHHPHSLSPCDTIVKFISKPLDDSHAKPNRRRERRSN